MSEQGTIDEVDDPHQIKSGPNVALSASPVERLAERRAQLYGALAKAQGEFPTIPRDRTVRVQMKTGGSYTFAYAPLDTILREVRPALASNGLGITQTFDGERLVTLLVHEGGGTIESALAVPRQGSSWQEYGSAVTYARRYAITALLGIASEEDDDGNAAAGNVATPQKRAGAGKAAKEPPKVNKRQTDLIHAILKRLAEHEMLTDEVYHGVLKKEYGVEHSTELTSAQASQLIERLKALEAKIPASGATESETNDPNA